MLDILYIVICLLITAVVAWNEGAKHERKKNNEQIHMSRRLKRYLGNSPLPRTWD